MFPFGIDLTKSVQFTVKIFVIFNLMFFYPVLRCAKNARSRTKREHFFRKAQKFQTMCAYFAVSCGIQGSYLELISVFSPIDRVAAGLSTEKREFFKICRRPEKIFLSIFSD